MELIARQEESARVAASGPVASPVSTPGFLTAGASSDILAFWHPL
jgi:hypothetical protein